MVNEQFGERDFNKTWPWDFYSDSLCLFLEDTERIHLRFCANFFLYKMEHNDFKNPSLVHVH